MFSHQEEHTINKFILLETADNQSLSVTSGHYVWASGSNERFPRLLRAAQIKPKYHVWTWSRALSVLQPAAVTHVSMQSRQGLYNPHTTSGSIIVDNVASATFTETLPASLAVHTLVTSPARLAYNLIPSAPLAGWLNSALLAVYFNSMEAAQLLIGTAAVHASQASI